MCAVLFDIKKAMPEPSDLAAVQANRIWVEEYGIDWQHALVQTVALTHPGVGMRRRPVRRESKVVEWSRRVAARRASTAAAAYATQAE